MWHVNTTAPVTYGSEGESTKLSVGHVLRARHGIQSSVGGLRVVVGSDGGGVVDVGRAGNARGASERVPVRAALR